MVRVIKGQKNSVEDVPKIMVTEPKQVAGGRLIDREVYKAAQLAKQIIKEGDAERKKRLSEGLKQIALASEEAMATGAAEAFAEAAKDAITIFHNKANRYGDVENDLRIIVQEIVQKILGVPASMNAKDFDALVEKGVDELRARRRLKLQFPVGRLAKLKSENAKLMTQLKKEPDFDLEEIANVPTGFIRVVTDVGSALCQDLIAIQSLSSIL